MNKKLITFLWIALITVGCLALSACDSLWEIEDTTNISFTIDLNKLLGTVEARSAPTYNIKPFAEDPDLRYELVATASLYNASNDSVRESQSTSQQLTKKPDSNTSFNESMQFLFTSVPLGGQVYAQVEVRVETHNSTDGRIADDLHYRGRSETIRVRGGVTNLVCKADDITPPNISPVDGRYFKSSQKITINSTLTDAKIYYTLDGNTPDANSTPYTDAFLISATTVVKAIAVKEGLGYSRVAEATLTLDDTPPNIGTLSMIIGDDGKTLTFTGASDDGSGIGAYTAEIKIGSHTINIGGANVSTENWDNGVYTHTNVFTNNTSAALTYKITAVTDNVGNKATVTHDSSVAKGIGGGWAYYAEDAGGGSNVTEGTNPPIAGWYEISEKIQPKAGWLGAKHEAKAYGSSGNAWKLPTKDELNAAYTSLYESGKPLHDPSLTDPLWSSSEETPNDDAWNQAFNDGDQNDESKTSEMFFRAVRSFIPIIDSHRTSMTIENDGKTLSFGFDVSGGSGTHTFDATIKIGDTPITGGRWDDDSRYTHTDVITSNTSAALTYSVIAKDKDGNESAASEGVAKGIGGGWAYYAKESADPTTTDDTAIDGWYEISEELSGIHNWSDAKTVASAYTGSDGSGGTGATGWKLPTKTELNAACQSLYATNTQPLHDASLTDRLWSSSDNPTLTGKAWSQKFAGDIGMALKLQRETHSVRAVRAFP